jgi:probable HAF family extracellular repeat protein
MRDLGTLGGPDAAALFINDRRDVAGFSYIDSSPNPESGVPSIDPFFWSHGKMYDVGSFGGTFGQPYAFNNRGQMVGTSNLPGDQTYHPFLWDKGVLTDLGTLGGDTAFPNWINDEGVIAGKADLPGESPQNHNAVIWKHGVIQDLGTLPGDACANAYFVNSWGDVVGTSENLELCHVPTGEHAFLWKHGGPMIDLNTLIPHDSGLELTFAVAINDAGVIAGFGVPPGCAPGDVEVCGHAYLLIPCNDDHDGRCGAVHDHATALSAVAKSALPQSRRVERQHGAARLRVHSAGAESRH